MKRSCSTAIFLLFTLSIILTSGCGGAIQSASNNATTVSGGSGSSAGSGAGSSSNSGSGSGGSGSSAGSGTGSGSSGSGSGSGSGGSGSSSGSGSGSGGSGSSAGSGTGSGGSGSSSGSGSGSGGSGSSSGSGSGSGSSGSSGGSGTGSGAPANALVLSNLQASTGWNNWGELPPVYDICPSPCPGVTWSMVQKQQSPSLSGNSTQFNLGGTTPYADVLWSLPLIGQFSTQGLPDTGKTLLPAIHNFTYDSYFYVDNQAATEALEFDINWYMNGAGIIWGTQCRMAGGNEWDIWDNVNQAWIPTGIACHPSLGAWNHLTIQVQRESDNSLLYQSITLNGATANLDKTYPSFTVPSDWYGVTVNYQMDGNFAQASDTTYIDNFTLTCW